MKNRGLNKTDKYKYEFSTESFEIITSSTGNKWRSFIKYLQ